MFYLANDFIFKIYTSIFQDEFIETEVQWVYFKSMKCMLIHKAMKCYVKLKSIRELLNLQIFQNLFYDKPFFGQIIHINLGNVDIW